MTIPLRSRASADEWLSALRPYCSAFRSWIALPDQDRTALEQATHALCEEAHARGIRPEELLIAIRRTELGADLDILAKASTSADKTLRHIHAFDLLLAYYFDGK